MMKKILVLASFLVLSSCEDLGGTLQVLKNFSATTKNGAHLLQVGTYESTLNFKRDRVIVSVKEAGGKIQFSINTPAGSSIPRNGNFEIKSVQSGQPFDVLGNNKTDEQRSEIRRGYESCQYQEVQPVCGPSGCSSQVVDRWGQRFTEYYLRTVTEDLKIDLTAIGSTTNTFAHFTGHSSYSEKVITQQGPCY